MSRKNEAKHWSDEVNVPYIFIQGLITKPDEAALIVVDDPNKSPIEVTAIARSQVTVVYEEGKEEAIALPYKSEHGWVQDLKAIAHATIGQIEAAVQSGDPTVSLDLDQVTDTLNQPNSTIIFPTGPKSKNPVMTEDDIPWDDAA